MARRVWSDTVRIDHARTLGFPRRSPDGLQPTIVKSTPVTDGTELLRAPTQRSPRLLFGTRPAPGPTVREINLMFAVIESGSHQLRVETGQVLSIDFRAGL